MGRETGKNIRFPICREVKRDKIIHFPAKSSGKKLFLFPFPAGNGIPVGLCFEDYTMNSSFDLVCFTSEHHGTPKLVPRRHFHLHFQFLFHTCLLTGCFGREPVGSALVLVASQASLGVLDYKNNVSITMKSHQGCLLSEQETTGSDWVSLPANLPPNGGFPHACTQAALVEKLILLPICCEHIPFPS